MLALTIAFEPPSAFESTQHSPRTVDPWYWGWGLLFGPFYLAYLVVGLPLVVFLKRARLLKLRHFVLAGAAGGILFPVIVTAYRLTEPGGWGIWSTFWSRFLKDLWIMVLLGVVCAVIFWCVSVAKPRRKQIEPTQ